MTLLTILSQKRYLLSTKKMISLKANAFSILETIIGMIVSAIIISIIYVIFNILFTQMDNYKQTNFIKNEVGRLRFALNKDMFESENLFLDKQKISFEKFDKELVFYDLSEENIIRKQKKFTDTFYLKPIVFDLDTLKNYDSRIVFQRIVIKAKADSILYQFKAYRPLLISNLLSGK